MTGLPSLKRGFLFNALFTSQNVLIPIISFAYLSRVLGPENLGKINIYTSLAAFFAFLATLALPLYGARAVSISRNDGDALGRKFSELFILQAGATISACAIYASLFLLVPRLRDEPALFLLAGGLLLCTLLSVDWLFSGLERYGTLFLRDAVLKTASLTLLVLLIRKPSDYPRFLAIGLCIGAATGFWGLLQARAHVHPRFGDLAPSRHLPSLSVMLACNLTAGIYAYLDTVLVGFLADDHAAGLYSAALRTNRMLVMFLTSLGMAIIPRLSYYSQHNMGEESSEVASKSIRFMLLIAWPASALMLALAPQILVALSGPEFLPAAAAMRISVPVIAASIFTNYLAFHVLFPAGGEKEVLKGTSLAAFISLLLNFLLVPVWGIQGAALTSVAGQAACGAVLLAGVRRRNLVHDPWTGSPAYLAGGAALGVAAWIWAGYAEPGPKGIAGFLAVAACAYGGFLYLIRDSLAMRMLAIATGIFVKKPHVQTGKGE